LVPWA